MNTEKILSEYIRILLASNSIHFLTIRGHPGLGKSYTVLKTLNDLGLEEDTHYKILNGYITPKKLFELLRKTEILEQPKLLVMDDLDSLLRNKISISILKGALVSFNDKRTVSYESMRGDDRDQSFNFNGKIIMITNSMPRSIDIEPLLDRGIYFEYDFNPVQLASYIEENILPTYDLNIKEMDSVWTKVRRFIDNPSFSIRILNRTVAFYKHNSEKWYSLFTRSLKK